jgi:hypothetical protein
LRHTKNGPLDRVAIGRSDGGIAWPPTGRASADDSISTPTRGNPMNAWTLLTAVALTATTAAGPASCDTSAGFPRPAPITEPITFREPAHNAPEVEVQAMCDERGKAYRIEPNTPAAHARAEEMCRNLQRSLEDVGWADPPGSQNGAKWLGGFLIAFVECALEFPAAPERWVAGVHRPVNQRSESPRRRRVHDSDSGICGRIFAMPRQSKGDRHPHTVRIPLDQHAVYAAEADRLGMDLGSYLVWRLAVAHGLEPTEQPPAARVLQLDLADFKRGEQMAS